MVDQIGQQQLGSYRLVRLLGRGGAADVYLGEHLYLKSQAAIKILHLTLSDQEQRDFLLEAQRLAGLKHPHIIQILDFAVENDLPFLVMEYAPSGTMRTQYPKDSRLPIETILSYVKQAAGALQYIHEQKLVHRDVKPENLLLRTEGDLLLSDFGIAAAAHTTGSLILQDQAGTPPYMAPEQILKMPREASDQYALGIVVYEWLCGKRPFDGLAEGHLYHHLRTPPQPLHEHLPTISPTIETVVLKALAKDPKERFASVQAFAAALEQAYQESVLDRHQEPQPASHWMTRRRMLLGLGLTGFVLAGGGLTWRLVHSHAAAPSTRKPAATMTPTATPIPQGTILSSYGAHSGTVTALAWSPDGKYLASAGLEAQVQISNAATGGFIYVYHGYGYLNTVAWSPDGRRIACGGLDQTVQVWDAPTGGHLYTYRGHTGNVNTIAWSPDSKWIASGAGRSLADGNAPSLDHSVQVWDATTGKIRFRYRGHSAGVNEIAWSPDGKWIASASDDITVQVWSAATGAHVFTYRGHRASLLTLAWSPGSTRIVSSDDMGGGGGIALGVTPVAGGTIAIQAWNALDGGESQIYRDLPLGAIWLAWSPDGKRIASCDYSGGGVQVWNAVDGGHVYLFDPTYQGVGSVSTVVWSPDGKRIAQGGNGPILVWAAG